MTLSQQSRHTELVPDEPENPCPVCKGEGYIGTGLGSFVDAGDSMLCPRCDGSGEA